MSVSEKLKAMGVKARLEEMGVKEDAGQAPAQESGLPAGFVKTVEPGSPEHQQLLENTDRWMEDRRAGMKENALGSIAAAAQTGSLGLGDQLAGVLARLKGGDYRKAQRQAEATLSAEQDKHPLASAAGVLPYFAVPAAGSVAGRVGTAGLQGLVDSAANSRGDVGAMDTAKDAGTGGVKAAGLQLGLEAASPVLGKLARLFRHGAESQGARAMGFEGGITDRMRKMGLGDEEARHALARTAMDEGLLDFSYGVWPPSKATVQERARSFIDQGTNAKDAALAAAEATGVPFSPDYAAAKARGYLTNLNPREARSLGPAVKSIEDIQALKNGLTDTSVVAADKLKSSLQQGVNYADLPLGARPDIANKLDKRVAAALRKSIEEHQTQALGPGAGDRLQDINRKIGQGLKIEEVAKNAASRAAQRNLVSQGDKVLAAGRMAAGGPAAQAAMEAVGYGLVHNLANQFGNATISRGLENFAEPGARLLSGANQLPSGMAAAQSLTADESRRRRLEELLRGLGQEP